MDNVKMAAAAGLALAAGTVCAASFPRLWVQNDYPMRNPDSWTLVSNLVERAAAAGYNGILSGVNLENAMNGWDKKALENYGKLRDLCALRGMDLIPSIWGMGYGGPACYWEPEAVEATAMKGLVYESDGEKLVFRSQPVSEAEFRACDFAKKTVVAHLKPFHHYRLTFKLKTENLLPDIYNKFRISCNYPETREAQLYDPPMKPTQDWTDVVFTFDTYDSGEVAIRAYKWRNTTGSFQVKDVVLSEWGPCHMLSSDDMAPVVRDMTTGKVYEPGRDYLPVPKMKVFREQPGDAWQTIGLLPGSRIAKGAKVSVDCWIPAVEGQRQYSACPSSEDIYRYFEESARKIEDFFHPKTWLLAVDEWRIANRCLRCQNRKLSPAELIGGAVSRQHAIIRKVNPKAEIAAWADMFAPTDNAHDHYYCVKGDLTGSWNHVPKDILMVVWENGHGPVALKHFADNGFRTLAGAYYDRDNLDNDRKWLETCRSTPGCQGMMYTTWRKKYGLLEAFAEMAGSGASSAASPAVEIDPLTTRWTFGAHEPFTMYRRVGRICTGAIDGNARWVGEWLDWFDQNGPEKMEEMGFNFLHSRFYKGMGWEVEKKDFPNVRRFVANCHAHGVRALAYVQFGTLYPEAMRREIPQVDSWAGVSEAGGHTLYCNMYFRWMPCLNCREWEDYLKRMCTIALTEGGFDGIMFDNVFDAPCYCARCERAFREHLKSVPDRQDRFGFEDLDYVLLPRIRLTQETKLEVQDPVAQEWLRWRADVMTGVLMRLRDHIKKVKPDAIVSGNPSPYRNRAEALYKAQNMAELCRAFDFIIMQNTNFPEVWANGVIRNRVRDLKFAQDMGQRIVALCDNVEHLRADHEAKFLLPMVEDIVFGGIPTDRTSIFPSPESGFVNRKVFESRKPLHQRFNAFAAAHAEGLSAPTMHSVRLFYPEREIYLSERDHQGIVAAEEILLRNRVPYGYLVSSPDDVMTVPKGTEVVVVPGLVSLSSVQVEALVAYAKSGGKLVVTGDAGRYDDWIAQHRVNPLLPQLRGLANVVCRAEADVIPNAVMGWGYKVPPPADGGAALMEDLRKIGWRPPVSFENMPPYVFAEYRQLVDGGLVVHLVNYCPEKPVAGARLVAQDGDTAVFEEPFAAEPRKVTLGKDGALPAFGMYAAIVVAKPL